MSNQNQFLAILLIVATAGFAIAPRQAVAQSRCARSDYHLTRENGCQPVDKPHSFSDPIMQAKRPRIPRKGVKTDIYGIRLGMTTEEVKHSFLKYGKCTVGKSIYCIANSIYGGAQISLSKGTNPAIAKEISVEFFSGSPPKAVVADISNQFGVLPTTPDCGKGVKYVMDPKSQHILSTFIATTICQWDLGNDIDLELSLHIPGSEAGPIIYGLTMGHKKTEPTKRAAPASGISGNAIPDKESEIKFLEKWRAVNPRPKF